VKALAGRQSADVAARLAAEGVRLVTGDGRLTAAGVVAVGDRRFAADVLLIATGRVPECFQTLGRTESVSWTGARFTTLPKCRSS
jgi:pyruvate/2-oxoglutarate dehydrogenase complex dihydrolipoamide dehydrogenase (E3) component